MAAKKKKAEPKPPRRSSTTQRIEELRRRIRELEAREAAEIVKSEPFYRHLKATYASLEKAVRTMDGRKGLLSPDFIRVSRQYLNLLERALDELAGKKRRGRKPSMELGG